MVSGLLAHSHSGPGLCATYTDFPAALRPAPIQVRRRKGPGKGQLATAPLSGRSWPDCTVSEYHSGNARAAARSNSAYILGWRAGDVYDFKSSGTLPPLSANFCMTCLCSQMFIAAESFMSPL